MAASGPGAPQSAAHPGPFVIGVDGGTEGLRAGVFDLTGHPLAYAGTAYATAYPNPAWVEQNPRDWWAALGSSVRDAVAQARVRPADVCGLCVDTTCCSVVALDAAGEPLRPALIWADVRAAPQAAQVAACADRARAVNGGGDGPVSPEWMIPKALWIRQHEPETYASADKICEYQDYVNLKLTGRYVASVNNVAVRWHWGQWADEGDAGAVGSGGASGGRAAKRPKKAAATPAAPAPGAPLRPPSSLLAQLGLSDLLNKWPQEALPLGARIGGLTAAAAAHLGLPEGLLVAQGGADAFVGMLGLGVVAPGQMAFLTGSSHLHLGLVDRPMHGKGVWGTYADALLPGSHVIEGGQTSTGSSVAWLRRLLSGGPGPGPAAGSAGPAAGGDASAHIGSEAGAAAGEGLLLAAPAPVPYSVLNAEAAAVPAGSEGLIVLDHFQGNRTPHTDPLARGVIAGLTLRHGRGHLFRATLEGIAFGTEAVLEAMRAAGFCPTSLTLAGGASNSELWLQIHADVSGLPLRLTRVPDAPALGSAMLAAFAAGHFQDLPAAAAAMVHTLRTVQPRPGATEAYRPMYRAYCATYLAMRPVLHKQAEDREAAEAGGGGGGGGRGGAGSGAGEGKGPKGGQKRGASARTRK